MSSASPALGALLEKELAEIFPSSLVAVVNGGGAVSDAFCRLPFDQLTFTGSTSVGKTVMAAAAENLTPVLLELPAQQAGDGWQYAATVEPKLERSGTPEPPVIIIPDNPAPTPGDKLPQTGLLQWPITLLAAIGVLLVAVGCRLRRRRKPT